MVPKDRNRTAIPRSVWLSLDIALNYTLGIRSDRWLCPFDLLIATMWAQEGELFVGKGNSRITLGSLALGGSAPIYARPRASSAHRRQVCCDAICRRHCPCPTSWNPDARRFGGIGIR
jgi:hypothetical protein